MKIGHSNIVGSTIQYQCDVGYNLIGTATRTCQENKMWSGSDSHCEKVLCPPPVAPTNGEITWRGHRYGRCRINYLYAFSFSTHQ